MRTCIRLRTEIYLIIRARPHTPNMKVRSREDALRETAFQKIDDRAWLTSLRSWLSDEQWRLLMVENPRELYNI